MDNPRLTDSFKESMETSDAILREAMASLMTDEEVHHTVIDNVIRSDLLPTPEKAEILMQAVCDRLLIHKRLALWYVAEKVTKEEYLQLIDGLYNIKI
ncbi:MAG: hypothetical protein KAR35_10195 [Candidatus Heimdallarchaeota archaeon]|nr:hypothetical protein [Candidatus Heimdallarchaeota archaeon]MCK5049726.1 hypothetical protein [Candidatus Heimdallarchaeota archaeon]